VSGPTVYVYPADLGGCGYYRLIWPAKVLQAAGHDIRLIHPKQAHRWLTGGLDSSGKLVTLTIPGDADVMVFQRITSARMVEGIQILRKNGIAVVVDIDDDLDAIEPSNPAWAALHPKTVGKFAEYSWRTASSACREATWVTVSTDALLERYARPARLDEGRRGTVLRNAVPEIFLDRERFPRQDSDVIGWPGALATHPHDPAATGPALGRLQRDGFQVRIVGYPEGTRRAFQLDHEPEATGPTTVDEWPVALNQLGVGIAPLASTRFNVAKSWLKPMELAALGVPCVFTPTPEYLRIHKLGVGEIARNPTEWYARCVELLRSEERRTELSERGRAAVAELTLQAQAWRWWEAWMAALHEERGPLGIRRQQPRVAPESLGAGLATTRRSSGRSGSPRSG